MQFSENDPIFQALKSGGHSFPGVWQYMLPEDFAWFRLPREKLCQCDDCYEVALGNYYHDCRCCNHLPQLPNYGVGLALLNPRCRELMQSVIDQRQGVPEGMRPTPAQYAASVAAYSKNLFGKSRELNCVFMDPDSQHCRVYEVRNGICATFFCQNDHGQMGYRFWESLLDLVVQLEFALQLWCIEQLGVPADEYMRRFEILAEDIGNVSDPLTRKWAEDASRTIWGDFFGREVEFYESCARLAMENRDDLFDIACRQPLLRPLGYERQERLMIVEKHRHEAAKIPADDYQAISIEDLWYKVQVLYRRLTEIPFNDGAYKMPTDVHLEERSGTGSTLAVLAQQTHRAWKMNEHGKKDILYLSSMEHAALSLFTQPHPIGEAILDAPEFVALEDPREFLAICLRRGFLQRS